ncbi:prolipoprotein diacylglyceryl transferase [Algimonas porphyrae]|uniref:Phosphatidylglycerol--prolipoprotein diacylglyceryl transferase n=2 Tax=Algimonas porphyrae TaxID=1128113 RepID=A0ABQ5UZ04_9PROT|nr:prolipoprotein diacylglyceryl transferase [Algimonas porphyrae]
MVWQATLINAIIFPSWLDSTAFSIGPISIEWYGIAYVVGLVLAYLYAARVAETTRYWVPSGPTRGPQIVPTRDDLGDLMFYAFIGILAGGRLGYVLFYDTDMLWTDPLQIILGIRGGGMSFHGGFLGVCAAVGYAAWRKNTSYMRFADLAWVGAPIGLGLVRVTNFVNQELYGHPTDMPWGVIFPNAPDSLPRHPSQLYEAFLEGLILWLILRFMTKRGALSKPGLITGAGVAGYGVFRFMVEFVRTPDPIPQFGMLTRGMAYSLPMVIVGLIVILWASRRQAVSPHYVAKSEPASEEATADNG